jgi:hypothetical protein
MLNDADGYQGGGNAGEEARVQVNDAEAHFTKLKRWVKNRPQQQGPSRMAQRGARRFSL